MKAKFLLLGITLLLTMSQSFAQAIHDWHHSFCPGDEMGFIPSSGQLDHEGNSYYAGNFDTNIDVDPGVGLVNLAPSGLTSSYILKLDEHGDFVSVIQYGISAPNGLVAISTFDINAQGEMIVLGTFNGTVDFDPGPSTYNLTAGGTFGVESFMVKFDTNGNFVWASKGEWLTSQLHLLDNGEIIMVRNCNANVVNDLDLTASVQNVSYPLTTGVIVRLNASGAYLWHKAFRSSNGQSPMEIDRLVTDSLGGSYYHSDLYSAQIFDPGGMNYVLDPLIQTSGSAGTLIMKLSNQGDILWEHVYVDSLRVIVEDIAVGPQLNLHTVGWYKGTVDMDLGVGTYFLSSRISSFFGTPAIDFAVAKYGPNGDLLWAGSFGRNENDDAASAKIVVDENEDCYITSKYSPSLDFDIDPGLDTVALTSTVFGYSTFILKLDPNGTLQWAETTHTDYVNTNGNASEASPVHFSMNDTTLLVTGNFYGGIDFDIEENSLDADSCYNVGPAIFMWQLDLCDPVEIVDSITSCDNLVWMDGNTYSNDTSNATYTIETPGQCDTIYRLVFEKLEESIRIDSVTSCGPYTWINGATYSLSTTTPLFVLPQPAVNGCDSVANLHVDITQITNAALQNGTTIEASFNNAQYQWLDCDNNFSQIIGETSQSFTASVNGNYAVEVTNGNCVDTSSCFSVTTVGIEELFDKNKVSIFPNPSSGHIDIQSSVIIESVEIIDTKGRTQLKTAKTHIDVSHLNSGVYLVRIQTDHGKMTKRFTKQ